MQRLVDELAAELTAEHARKALTALRVALRVAQRYGEVDANPCAGVRVPASADGEKPARILTPEESAAIVAAAEADDVRLRRSFGGPVVGLLFGSGLRLGEALALRYGPDGLDLDTDTVRVRASLDRVRGADGDYTVHAPKSRAARRDVPLADMFVTAQGSPATRFRRAVERKSLLNAELAAREMGQLNLEEALSLVLLYAAADDPRFDRAATRWIARLCTEGKPSLSELQAAVSALALLRRGGGEAAARLLLAVARN